MSNRIRVSQDRMGNDVKSLTEQLERTKHEVEYLADSMNKLSTCWEGPAWAAFQTTVNEDIEYMLAVCNEIAALVSNISESQKKYAQGEKQNYDSMNSIWI